MFNFKKTAALLCAVAISATAIIVPTYAKVLEGQTNVKATLSSGNTAFSSSKGRTYISLNLEGLDELQEGGEYVTGGNIIIRMTKGIFSGAAKSSLGEEGLYDWDEEVEPGFEVNFVDASLNPDYDQIGILFNGNDAPLTTETGAILDIRLQYADTTNLGDAEIWIVSSNEDPNVQLDLVDADKNLTGERMKLADNNTKYFLASGTNEITEVIEETEAPATEAPATEAPATEAPATEAPATEAPATEAPATEAPTYAPVSGTIFGGYVGDDNDDDISSAVTAGLVGNGITAANSVLWTVKAEGVTKTYTQTIAQIEGETTIKVALIIKGLAQGAIETVTAVLQ